MEDFLFALSKLLVPLFDPLFLVVAALCLLIGLAWKRLARFFRILLPALVSSLFFLATPLGADLLSALWEYPLGPGFAPDEEPYDAVILLGGTVDPAAAEGSGQIQANDSFERLYEAAKLVKTGRAGAVVATGGSGDFYHPEAREAFQMKEILLALGVPEDKIFLESASRNTHENALESFKIARDHGFSRLLLLSSAYHLRRSDAIFAKAGFTRLPAGYVSPSGASVPQTTGLAGEPGHGFASGAELAGAGGPPFYRTYSVDTRRRPLAFPDAVLPGLRSFSVSCLMLREMAGYATYALLGRL